MRRPAELYLPSGASTLDYPFRDTVLTATTCGRICFNGGHTDANNPVIVSMRMIFSSLTYFDADWRGQEAIVCIRLVAETLEQFV
jgi:hypothetical protein